MKKLKVFFLSFILSISPLWANAQTGCIRVDQIAKWEVLDSTKTVIYDPQGNSIAFIIFDGYSPPLQKSGENFRFFSPTICKSDRVQITKGMTTISFIEPIRKWSFWVLFWRWLQRSFRLLIPKLTTASLLSDAKVTYANACYPHLAQQISQLLM